MLFKYQIILVGSFEEGRGQLETPLFAHLAELGVDRTQIVVLDETQLALIEPRAPIVVVFLGYDGATDEAHPCLSDFLRDSLVIIPCVENARTVSAQLPENLRHINAFSLEGGNPKWERLATLVLENLRLLRTDRRLFISYKRSESQGIAIQLYEALDQAGFDVFLDTRSVPYAVDFQGVLWHRMADSDIVVLLDTPDFRSSHWTQQELSQANATNIQILHLLWPDVLPDKSSAFSEFVSMSASDFKASDQTGPNAQFIPAAVRDIVSRAESLRARALAARHRSLVDSFCDQAHDSMVKSVAVQPERFISVELTKGEKIAVVPTIGVPRADVYQDMESAIRKMDHDPDRVWLLYDERGLLDKWLTHLDWLNSHLPVSAVRISNCTDHLTGATK